MIEPGNKPERWLWVAFAYKSFTVCLALSDFVLPCNTLYINL